VTDQTALPTLENPHHRASLYLVGSLMVLDETTPIPDVTQVHSALLHRHNAIRAFLKVAWAGDGKGVTHVSNSPAEMVMHSARRGLTSRRQRVEVIVEMTTSLGAAGSDPSTASRQTPMVYQGKATRRIGDDSDAHLRLDPAKQRRHRPKRAVQR
jgi:hypothetical protein